MSVPPIFKIRVVRMAKVIPGNVVLILPDRQGHAGTIPDPPQPDTYYVPVELPEMGPYDECLGRFLRTWGTLESILRQLFEALSDMDVARASALSATLSGKALSDAISSLAGAVLPEQREGVLAALVERLSAVTNRRNFIVHGYWIAEVICYNNRKLETIFKLEVMREYPVTSRAGSKGLANPRNQKIRAKHLFRTKKIDEIGVTAEGLRDDFVAFIRATWPNHQRQPAEWT